MLTDTEKREIQKIITFFFGESASKRIEVNQASAKVVWDMLQEAQKCSNNLDLVPRPAGFMPGISYIVKELVKIAARITSNDQIYLVCKNQVAGSWRTKLELAAMGL